jgi:hypothetical protein
MRITLVSIIVYKGSTFFENYQIFQEKSYNIWIFTNKLLPLHPKKDYLG